MKTTKKSKDKDKFWNLKVPVFHNKANGQMTVHLPKKKLKKKNPKFCWLRIEK